MRSFLCSSDLSSGASPQQKTRQRVLKKAGDRGIDRVHPSDAFGPSGEFAQAQRKAYVDLRGIKLENRHDDDKANIASVVKKRLKRRAHADFLFPPFHTGKKKADEKEIDGKTDGRSKADKRKIKAEEHGSD